MVLSRSSNLEETMPQTVPSAGFTPPCDYSNFAYNFDLSLLPGGDSPIAVSPSTTLYSPPPLSCGIKPKISTTYFPNSPQSVENNDIDLGPDFQKLLGPEPTSKQTTLYPPSPIGSIYLEVPSTNNCHPGSPSGSLSPYSPQSLLSPNDHFATFPSPNSDHQSLYPSSPSDISLYPHSPNSYYSHSPSDNYTQFVKKEFYPNSPVSNSYPTYIKEENYLSPCGSIQSPSSPPSYSNLSSPPQVNISNTHNQDVLDLLGSAIIKQEATIDFENILQSFNVNESIRGLLENTYKSPETQIVPEKPKSQDHQLLREVLRDTSFQKKYNIKPFDFGLMESHIKMEEPDDSSMMNPCSEQLPREKIDPVLNLAIEQMRKDVSNTCAALGISPDPSQWSSANVLSWLQWTSNQFGLPAPMADQWDLPGSSVIALAEEDFTQRAPQGGSILHAQLEIWKAACSEEDLSTQWMPESTSSNASSGDMSDEDEEESTPEVDTNKPTTSRGTGSSHIHLWQFLKELLASPQTHGSCIRWIDRSKGIFKIEDSVKVARLWGKRKNRPAMNYDKLSRSIRQYYKKGIMKKTERSQRLVYQFCHPYNL